MNTTIPAVLARRTKRGVGAVAAGAGALLLSALLASGPAFALPPWNDPTDGPNWIRCDGGINHRDASCLHGWWNNRPRASTGVALGSTWGSQSRCAQWGTVYSRVHTNEAGGSYYGYLMENWDKKRGYHFFSDVKSIKCCPDRAELCHKSQVEAISGKIKVWNTDTRKYDKVNVSTRAKRQEFCNVQANRYGVYCRNDPSGDALDGVPFNCDGGTTYCTVADCQEEFEKSAAYPNCSGSSAAGGDILSDPEYSISATDGTSRSCTVTAGCRNGHETSPTGSNLVTYINKTFTADVYDVDEYVNCNDTDEIVHEDDSC